MGARNITLAPDEWYHCFTRGVEKRKIFLDVPDYERFLMLLYACNNVESLHISTMGARHQGPALTKVLERARGLQLVDIGAYCLMPSHPHLLLRERDYGGISLFMQKVGTGYTMYFNKKYNRTGTLFSSRFKALHIATDQYLERVTNYIHANPAELYEPRWKEGIVQNKENLKKLLSGYQFSSLPDYESKERATNVIINKDVILDLLEGRPSFESLMDDAKIYHRQYKDDLPDQWVS